MTLLYTSPVFLRHDTGRHPERIERLQSVAARLAAAGLDRRCTPGTVAAMSEDEVRGLHEHRVLSRARDAARQGGGHLDSDTVVCPESFDVALHAAGTCAAAVDAVVSDRDTTALCLVRPPGHHATPSRSMGFCLFNNVALAAQRARKAHGLSRILIVDWDVHHGNGTQDLFYADPEVFFLSIHRFGWGFYPGTGDADETGRGPGLGFTLNVPIPHGSPKAEYHDQFSRALEAAADKIKPELVLVSAGFDAHRNDPIGSLGLDAEDFATLTRAVLDVARTHAGGRLVSCLEGGYNLDALAASVEAHLTELLAANP